jgi:hypothetical protein
VAIAPVDSTGALLMAARPVVDHFGVCDDGAASLMTSTEPLVRLTTPALVVERRLLTGERPWERVTTRVEPTVRALNRTADRVTPTTGWLLPLIGGRFAASHGLVGSFAWVASLSS